MNGNSSNLHAHSITALSEYAYGSKGVAKKVVIKSPRAFDALAFVREESVDGSIWHPKRMSRDRRARNDYKALVVSGDVQPDDIFMIDLLRGAVL